MAEASYYALHDRQLLKLVDLSGFSSGFGNFKKTTRTAALAYWTGCSMTILWSVSQVSIDRDEMQVGSLLSAGTFHSPLDHVSAHLIGGRGLPKST
jgi:hypothetical protein